MIDKNRIYVGYNKNNERCLLYELDENNYKDLEDNFTYTSEEIYLSSLVEYSELVEIKKNKSLFTRSFVNAYQYEEYKNINLKKVFIAPIYVITQVSDDRWEGSTYSALCRQKLIKKRELLLREDFYTYINLFNNQRYNEDFFYNVGDFHVNSKHIKPFASEIGLCETHLPKRKILQLYVDKYGIE